MTALAASMVGGDLGDTPLPAQAPVQPAGSWNRGTGCAPSTYSHRAVQVVSQCSWLPSRAMPAGWLATLPIANARRPSDGYLIHGEGGGDCFGRVHVLTWQTPLPVQAPVQPLKLEPASAVAVNVTTVPYG